jgi:zinc transport system permease protein
MNFFESAFLWKEAVIASTILAMALSVTGIFVILRRVVFLPAALSQVSGLGVVLSFWLGLKIPELADAALLSPFTFALVITLIAALLLGSIKEPKRLSRETITGVAYIVASGLVVAIGAAIPQESHAVTDVLFGNAVMVGQPQMYQAILVSVTVLGLHRWLFHPFLLVSLDAETARAHGVPVRLIDGILFLSMGLIISVATKTIGAMPVFAFSVLPPAAALQLFSRTKWSFIAAPIMGAVSAFVGYYISFTFDKPTGACTVVTAGAIFLITRFPSRRLQKRAHHPGTP